jgi:ferric-dicitrate binding protein FerR (iron transport regulator)
VKPIHGFNRLAIAASLILVCTVSYFTLNYWSKVTTVNLQSNNKVLTDTLSDGSVITMNALSRLTYPDKFKGNTRTVGLEGEAFFKITPDKTKPFIINVNGVTVRVVGTSFNIKSRNGKTEVIVETGIVNVSRAKNSINLNPGEKTVVLKSDDNFNKQRIQGKLYSYYINNELVCDRTPLSELVAALNEIYGAHIVITKQSLNQLPITTVFKKQPLEQVLSVVTATFPITVEHKGSQIILK